MTAIVTYEGELRTRCVHLRSDKECITDAPKDNNGLGRAFSPTDIVATGLASCIITVMGIKAKDLDLDLKGAVAEVTKHMASNPRRISKIEVNLLLPANVSERNRTILKRTGNTCPVHYSLHPAIEKIITYSWTQG